MDLSDRYERNMTALSAEENARLRSFGVCVVGCGGLGGYIIEMLGRMGIGRITAVDGDVFEPTNLNRQLLSQEGNLGQFKAQAAKARMAAVNSEVEVRAVCLRLTRENGCGILSGHDLVMDALDNVPARLALQACCKELGIPLVHGAINGWYAQVCTVFPGEDTLSRMYGGHEGGGGSLGNPSFIPPFAASLQAAEAVKVLLGRGELLRGRVLFADLLAHEYDIISL